MPQHVLSVLMQLLQTCFFCNRLLPLQWCFFFFTSLSTLSPSYSRRNHLYRYPLAVGALPTALGMIRRLQTPADTVVRTPPASEREWDPLPHPIPDTEEKPRAGLGKRKTATPAAPPAQSDRCYPCRQNRGPGNKTSTDSLPPRAYDLNDDFSD